jgi:hypothetical protein
MHHPKHRSTGYIGWYGVAAVLTGFTLINIGPLPSSHWLYHVLNLTGSIAISYDAYRQRNMQPVVLNIFWGTISLIGLARFFLG